MINIIALALITIQEIKRDDMVKTILELDDAEIACDMIISYMHAACKRHEKIAVKYQTDLAFRDTMKKFISELLKENK